METELQEPLHIANMLMTARGEVVYNLFRSGSLISSSLPHSVMEPGIRRTRSPSPTYKLDDEDDTYEPYIPVAQRRQERLAKLSSLGFNSTKKVAKRLQEEQQEREDAQQEEEIKKEKARKERLLLVEAQEVQKKKATEGD